MSWVGVGNMSSEADFLSSSTRSSCVDQDLDPVHASWETLVEMHRRPVDCDPIRITGP